MRVRSLIEPEAEDNYKWLGSFDDLIAPLAFGAGAPPLQG
jgi:hypothetical protein